MAYVNGKIGTGEVNRIVCDECAERGEVRFVNDKHGVPMQVKPWRWLATLSATCDKCGKGC
jgi:hypothetical protein